MSAVSTNHLVPKASTSTAGYGFVVDEDDMSSNSATKVPTQQSVKAYVDAQSSGGGDMTIGILAGEFISRTTTGAGVSSSETSTNKVNYDGYDFDSATQEFVQAWRYLPSNYTTSATVTAHFNWTAASGSGGVVWACAARCFSDDDAIDAAMGTAVQVADTFLAAGDTHQTAETSAITIAGSPAAGKLVCFEFKRVPADGSDTLAVDATLKGVCITYT